MDLVRVELGDATADESVRESRSPDASPSNWLLVLGFVSLAVSTALFLQAGMLAHFSGWATASIAPILLVALWRRRNEARLVSSGIVMPPLLATLATALLVSGLAVAALHAWLIARELA